MNLIQTLEQEQMASIRGGKKLPAFRAGDTVKVTLENGNTIEVSVVKVES